MFPLLQNILVEGLGLSYARRVGITISIMHGMK
jgi:hypothetical protein